MLLNLKTENNCLMSHLLIITFYVFFLCTQDQNVRFINRLDEAILHLVFAGSDIILCQSFDDPVLQVPVSSLSLYLEV
jgi:hypothetical protein